MKRYVRLGAVGVALVCAISGLVIANQSFGSSPEALVRPACNSIGSGPVTRRVFITGESWASKGRLLPEVPQALHAREGGHILVCTLGFSGSNSSKIADALTSVNAAEMLGGKIDNVVILTGVNDQIQHRGSDFYATNIKRLMQQFYGSKIQIVSAPIVNDSPPLAVHLRAKNIVYGWFNSDDHDDYERALAASTDASQIINFRDFSPGFNADRDRFAADGIHLTPTAFDEYGSFIGQKIDLSE